MAGTRIEIQHNSDEILRVINKIVAKGLDASPAMADIASYMDLRTRENFDQEQSPDGMAWAPLSDTTQALRAAKSTPIDKILHGESLNLRDEIHLSYDRNSAEISTGQPAEPYAAMMQFGGTTSAKSMIPGKEIPARPYLGFSDDDREFVLDILSDFLLDS